MEKLLAQLKFINKNMDKKIQKENKIVWNNFTEGDMLIIASHLRDHLEIIEILMERLPIDYTDKCEMFEEEIYEILINTDDPND